MQHARSSLFIPVLIPTLVSVTPALAGGQPDADITTYDASGMAPFTLHVHALDSTLGSGDVLESRFEWDFDDVGSAYNRLEGFNAAHVYDDPGTYTVTLTLTNDEGEVDTQALTVNVSADTRDRIYVSEDGSNGNDGSSPSEAVRTWSRMQDLMDDDTMVLFHRGDRFDVSSGEDFNYSNWIFTDYGSSSDPPEIRWVGGLGGADLIGTQVNDNDILIEHLYFTSIHTTTDERDIVSVLVPGGRSTTLRECSIGHVTDVVNCQRVPRGVMTIDNEAPTPDSVRAYFCWTMGQDHVHLGNLMRDSMHEHNIRLASQAERVLISNNEFQNGPPKTCLWNMVGEYVYVTQNEFVDGRIQIGPNPYGDESSNRSRWCVFERNRLTVSEEASSGITFRPGALNTVLRNNVIVAADQGCIHIDGYDSEHNRRPDDIRVYNNTGINTDDTGRFLLAVEGAEHIEMINNLYVAPELTTGISQTANVYIEDNDLDTIDGIHHNVWAVPAIEEWVPDARHYVWPYWSHEDGYRTPSEWSSFSKVWSEAYATVELDDDDCLVGNTIARTHGTAIPGVHTDFYGNTRPDSGDWAVGAVGNGCIDDSGDGDLGDLDSDGAVGVGDLVILLSVWGEPHEPADLNMDGLVNTPDLLLLVSNWDEDGVPGDIDNDGVIGSSDLLLLLAQWGGSGNADLDGNGIVDNGDLLLMLVFWSL